MTFRYVLTRRWLGWTSVVVAVVLVASIGAPSLLGAERTMPTSTVLPVVVALLATGLACAAGLGAAGSDRTPYW